MDRFEYVALIGSFVLVGLETLIRIVTLAMRESCPRPRPAGLTCPAWPSEPCVYATMRLRSS